MTAHTITFTYMESPLGRILVARNAIGLTRLAFQEGSAALTPDPAWHFTEDLPGEAVAQLRAYFEGTRRYFDLPMVEQGTPFQQAVWEALQRIPYGETTTYAALAASIGRPKAVRALGAANGRNPWPIVVPCHRVVGSNGALTGYAGGIRFKAALLALEHAHSNPSAVSPSFT